MACHIGLCVWSRLRSKIASKRKNIMERGEKNRDFSVEMDCHSLLPGVGTKSYHALIQIVLFFFPRVGWRQRGIPVAFRWCLHQQSQE